MRASEYETLCLIVLLRELPGARVLDALLDPAV